MEIIYDFYIRKVRVTMRGIDTQVRKMRRRIFKEVASLAYNSENLKDDMEALPYKIIDYETKLSEEIIRNIVNSNINHDFSAIKTILDKRKSIKEDVNNGEYGVWTLFKDYEHYKYKEKQNNVDA